MTGRFISLALTTVCLMAAPLMASAQVVDIETNHGTISVELNAAKAPISVKNFLGYVQEGFYSNTVFHRIIKGFMIQGGGFDTSYRKKPTKPPIKLEAGNGLSNKRGTIAMARTSVLDSATCQFFINHKDNAMLDSNGGGYAVFGKVVNGMEVVDKIASVAVSGGAGGKHTPTSPVIIKSATVRK